MDETVPRSWLPTFMRKPSRSGEEPDSDETTSLLPKSSNGVLDSGNENIDSPSDDRKSTTEQVLKELVILLKGSIPVILAYALQTSLQTVSVVIVGRGSPEDLATAAFSYMFAMSTGWLVALGGTTALDTLCSSAFTGSKNPHDLGVLLQRAFIVLGLLYVPVAVLWIASEPVFLALGQPHQLSRDSSRFLRCLIPGGLGYIYFECMKKYLQAQGLEAEFSWTTPILTPSSRDHETRYLRPTDHLSYQCWPQLSFRLHLQDGPSGGSAGDGYILLALISTTAGIRLVRQGLGILGRMVTKVLAQYRNVCAPRHPRTVPGGYRMVGIRDCRPGRR